MKAFQNTKPYMTSMGRMRFNMNTRHISEMRANEWGAINLSKNALSSSWLAASDFYEKYLPNIGRALLVILTGLTLVALAVKAQPAEGQNDQMKHTQWEYHVTTVPGTITVIDYQHRSSTEVGFEGSPMMPNAKGTAKVISRTGRIAVEAEFKNMQPARTLGPEFLTYVLWAITPEGKASNLGEIILDGDHSKIGVTTSLQTFGLVVTAEPYFAVSEPSDAVVLQNTILPQTTGTIEPVNASYMMFGRTQYDYDATRMSGVYTPGQAPLELSEARNAVAIAEADDAADYAPDAYQKAKTSLLNAETLNSQKGDRKMMIQSARDAVQNAADARHIAVTRYLAESEATEKARAAKQTAAAEAAAAQSAERSREEAMARQQADMDRQRAELQSQQDQQARVQAQQDAATAQLKAQQDAAAAAVAQAQAMQSQQDAANAQAEAARAQKEREELRASLLQQFNRILPTTDTPRGLRANLSDVLFATAKFDLRPDAREALAKFSGIVLAHPGLRISVEGYTDSTGGDVFNQTLSENRARSVQAYLVDQGINPSSIQAQGFGKSSPVASNDTATGRQQNRRVEIIISGEIIGTPIGDRGGN